MTTRRATDELAWKFVSDLRQRNSFSLLSVTHFQEASVLELLKPEDVTNNSNVSLPEPITTALSATRRRVCATYCPRRGWVEVRLRPVRLHCTGCGLEARP